MRKFDPRAWSAFLVRDKDKPAGPHYAAVLLDTRTEYHEPYDAGDSPTMGTYPETHYFAFPDRETLATWVGEATAAQRNFFFFHVAKLGEATVRVALDLEGV